MIITGSVTDNTKYSINPDDIDYIVDYGSHRKIHYYKECPTALAYTNVIETLEELDAQRFPKAP